MGIEPGRIGRQKHIRFYQLDEFPTLALHLDEAGGANKFGTWHGHHVLRTGILDEDHTG